jgi:hypothetical protein
MALLYWTISVMASCINTLLFTPPPHGARAPSGPGPPPYRSFTITLRHTTLGRTPLDEWSVRRRDLYLTTHNTHKTQTSMSPAGFEPTIPASERSQTHDRTRGHWNRQTHHLLPLIMFQFEIKCLSLVLLFFWGTSVTRVVTVPYPMWVVIRACQFSSIINGLTFGTKKVIPVFVYDQQV